MKTLYQIRVASTQNDELLDIGQRGLGAREGFLPFVVYEAYGNKLADITQQAVDCINRADSADDLGQDLCKTLGFDKYEWVNFNNEEMRLQLSHN